MNEPSRYHSPYAHWVSGLLTELLTVAGFMAALVAAGFVLAAIR